MPKTTPRHDQTSIFSPLEFPSGSVIKNRLALAPLTNMQSDINGCLSQQEIDWLVMRAQGGFSLTMTAAAYIHPLGQAFPGQLGIACDQHLEKLRTLASAIKAEQSLAIVQLHHGGLKASQALIKQIPVSASENEGQSRALSIEEVKQLITDFITAAQRAQTAGFDGIEIHGAHSYIIGQFLSAEFNRREDQYGGSFENRLRLLTDIIEGIREHCGKHFVVGVRLSPERHGIYLSEAIATAKHLIAMHCVDFLDISLWDIYKEPNEAAFQGRSLMSYFTELDRGKTKLCVVGKIYTQNDILHCLDQGADFVMLGRAAILHHDYPKQLNQHSSFQCQSLPVDRAYLQNEGLGEVFIDYLATNWNDFVVANPTS